MKNRTIISLSILLLSLVACSTVESSGNTEFVSQSNHVERIRVDSVMLHDSVFIRERYDTVFYTRYRTVYKERLRVDTVVRCDTIFHDREVVVEKVRNVGGRSHAALKLSFLVGLLFLLWRAGLLPVARNYILKGLQLCKRIFHLKE